jgi:sulfatase modifying factor 1
MHVTSYFLAGRRLMTNQWLFAAVTTLLCGAAASGGMQPQATQPAQELTLDLGDNVTLKVLKIPAGKFMMGSPEGEKDRSEDEAWHEVTMGKAFYMGITAVTVDQFSAFVKDTGLKTDAENEGTSFGFEITDGKLAMNTVSGGSWRNPSFDQKGNHPVVQVSWNDARAFCDWLSKKTGMRVDLPTEAQWEYSCRAGTRTAYPWGDNPDEGKGWANCRDQSLKKKLPNVPSTWTFFTWDDGFIYTSPVASFKPNGFGLYDMTGNTWQWCQDRYGDYEKGAGASSLRVLRGGAWSGRPLACRSACRFASYPNIRRGDSGFRVVVAGGSE